MFTNSLHPRENNIRRPIYYFPDGYSEFLIKTLINPILPVKKPYSNRKPKETAIDIDASKIEAPGLHMWGTTFRRHMGTYRRALLFWSPGLSVFGRHGAILFY